MLKGRKYIGWLFLLPSLIIYIYFFINPAIQAFKISFYKWVGFREEMVYVGLKNYIRLSKSSDFLSSLKTTLIILFVGGIFILIIALVFSTLLNSGIRRKKLYRNIIFFPYVVAPVVHAIFWGLLIYSPGDGLLNRFFKLLGIEFLSSIAFLSDKFILWSVLALVIWVFVGFFTIITLAGIDRIPKHLYEAAKIEGANQLGEFFKITLPLVKEVLVIEIILWEILAIKMFGLLYAFGIIYPPRPLWTTGIYLILVGWGKGLSPSFQLGYAATIGVVMLFTVLLISLITRLALRRETYEY